MLWLTDMIYLDWFLDANDAATLVYQKISEETACYTLMKQSWEGLVTSGPLADRLHARLALDRTPRARTDVDWRSTTAWKGQKYLLAVTTEDDIAYFLVTNGENQEKGGQ